MTVREVCRESDARHVRLRFGIPSRPYAVDQVHQAVLGLIATVFYNPLIPYAFIGILLAICGFTVIGAARPE